MSMICGHCGSEVKSGFTVCASCGANLRRNLGLWTIGLSALMFFTGAVAYEANVFSALIAWAIAAFVLYRGWQKRWYRRNH